MNAKVPAPAADPSSTRRWRSRALRNLLEMGHCAPTVMRTLLDLEGSDAVWPVLLVAGLPGGIGNTRAECGGVTASVALLGLQTRAKPGHSGLPLVFHQGQQLCARFSECHGSLSCRDILGDRRVPLPCVKVVRRAPELYSAVASSEPGEAMEPDRLRAYARSYRHFAESEFHCAHAVLRQLPPSVPVPDELLGATSGFLGGTLLSGMTCSALTAGVMAVGLALGKVEHSRARVARLLARMVLGGDAFDDSLNEFNRIMNIGHRMARWFSDEFGSTQCRAITEVDFSSPAGVARYVASDSIAHCRGIALAVAGEVRRTLATRGAAA